MMGRLLLFLTSLFLGGLFGAWLEKSWPQSHALPLGIVVAASCWMLLDGWRIGQLKRWLRTTPLDDSAPAVGACGEIATKIRRLLRDRERQIQDSNARLQDFLAAMQASPNGVMLLDGDAHIEWCNQMAATHFGLDAKRDLSQAIGNLVRDPGFASYLAGDEFRNGLTMPGRDSTPTRPVALSVQLYPYGEGRKLLLSRDITALDQAEAMRRDFVANVSHEIRTPLTVLAGFVETLQTLKLVESERQQYLALMAQQADRMQTLVSDLLTLSKLEGSAPPGLDVHVAVRSLMRHLEADAMALSQVMGSANDTDHQFLFECGFDGYLAGAPSELLSAMGNLISNAVRYTPAGGHIKVTIQELAEGGLTFSVADTGPGIAAEHLGRLTERFYRVDRSRSRETGGTGLGLAIVKHVAQRHGATLLIESKVGQGSVFTLTFPASRVVSMAAMADVDADVQTSPASPLARLGGQ